MELNRDNILVERKTKTVYKDNDKVVKLFVEDYSKGNILNEALIHARVEENTDLNVPKLLEVSTVGNRWALAQEYIEGTTLEELINANPDKLDEYLDLFVKIQLDILGHQVPQLNRIKDKFKRKLTETDILDENTRYELLQRIEGMKNHTKLCHGDLNPSNIILKDNGEYYIIDWAHATQGNASADAARTYLIFSMEGKCELAEKYLDMFSKKSNIEKASVWRWLPIVAATQLTKKIEDEKEFLEKWVDIAEYQ